MRGKGEGSIYQRGDGYWVAQLSHREDGKRKLTRRVRTTQKEAKAALKELHRETEAGVTSDARLTVAAYAQHWLDDVLPHSDMRESTVENYAKLFRNYVIPYVGHYRLTALRPVHVERMLAQLADKGLSARTRQHARATLIRLLRRAQKQELVLRNVAEQAEGPKNNEIKVDDVLTADQARAVIAAATDHRLGAIATLALKLGLRKGEILGLRWEDVDLDDRQVLRVSGTLKRRTGGTLYRESRAKTKAGERELPLVNGTLEALQRRRQLQREERIKAGPLWRDTGYVFTTRIEGKPIDPTETTRLWHSWCEAAGVGRRRFHSSRHTAATVLLSDGVPLEKVSQMLGHASYGITFNTYSHPSTEDLRSSLVEAGERHTAT